MTAVKETAEGDWQVARATDARVDTEKRSGAQRESELSSAMAGTRVLAPFAKRYTDGDSAAVHPSPG